MTTPPKNTKPFNLAAAKLGKPIVTRDGAAVQFVAHVPEANTCQRVLARVGAHVFSYDENGAFAPGCRPCSHDLFMVQEKRTVYVNFYPHGGAYYHSDEAKARDAALGDAIAVAVPAEINA